MALSTESRLPDGSHGRWLLLLRVACAGSQDWACPHPVGNWVFPGPLSEPLFRAQVALHFLHTSLSARQNQPISTVTTLSELLVNCLSQSYKLVPCGI